MTDGARVDERSGGHKVHAIHIPFKREPLLAAMEQFSVTNYPLGYGVGYYSREAHISFRNGLTLKFNTRRRE